MSKLSEIYNQLSKFENGTHVANRMVQLWDLVVKPDDPVDTLQAERLVNVIIQDEEGLLKRRMFDIAQ